MCFFVCLFVVVVFFLGGGGGLGVMGCDRQSTYKISFT